LTNDSKTVFEGSQTGEVTEKYFVFHSATLCQAKPSYVKTGCQDNGVAGAADCPSARRLRHCNHDRPTFSCNPSAFRRAPAVLDWGQPRKVQFEDQLNPPSKIHSPSCFV